MLLKINLKKIYVENNTINEHYNIYLTLAVLYLLPMFRNGGVIFAGCL